MFFCFLFLQNNNLYYLDYVFILRNYMKDTNKHQGLRNQLALQLQKKGIIDQNVLEVIKRIPRHLFINSSFEDFAYQDKAFPIGAGQTISQPYTVAFQSQLLEVKKDHKILEIGTGSGYQTAILVAMGAKVYSIERQKELFDKTKSLLNAMGYAPKLFYGDGYKGQPTYGPFDKILITCGAPFIPEELIGQLKIGGQMVIPVGAGEIQTMTYVIKISEDQIEKKEFSTFKFVPMLENKEWGK